MKVEPLLALPDPDWLRLRAELWTDCTAAEHLTEMARSLAEPNRYAQFIARSGAGEALGFAEASIRHDYVPGTESTPVAFLEGLYVHPTARRRGVARHLVQAVASWAHRHRCSELASDTPLANTQSQAVHRRLGFAEVERVVFFNMPIGNEDAA